MSSAPSRKRTRAPSSNVDVLPVKVSATRVEVCPTMGVPTTLAPEVVEEPPKKTKMGVAEGPQKKMMRIKLVSNDGVHFEVDEDVAFKSKVIKTMMMDLGITDPDDEKLVEPIPTNYVDGRTLKKILEYCTAKRSEVYRPVEERDEHRVVLDDWDNEFLDISSAELMAMVMGAHYLDVPGLCDIIEQKIANMADGRSVEELGKIFLLNNDFTAKEKEKLKKQYAWVEKKGRV